MARLIAIAVALAAAWIGLRFTTEPPALIGWALAIAAGGTFVPLLLGMHWRGCSATGGLLGTVAGVAVVAMVFLLEMGGPADNSAPSGVGPIGAAALAILAALAVSVAVSLLRRERHTAEMASAARSGDAGSSAVLQRSA
jgi:cation/acetate symporter